MDARPDVTKEMIIDVCVRVDVSQLRHWGQQGVRVSSGEPLAIAVDRGLVNVLQCLLKELGANVEEWHEGSPLLFLAAHQGHVAVVKCLVNEFGADVNQRDRIGYTSMFIAAAKGHTSVVQCLVKELGADLNIAAHNGMTPLMIASYSKHMDLVRWLIKEGADTQASLHEGMNATAADISKLVGASAEQTAYLEAKTHCSNPDCSGAGIKRCPACKQARYCGEPCQYAHWKAHKGDCKRWSAEIKAGTGTSSGK
jgi:ankyrin repeat protein